MKTLEVNLREEIRVQIQDIRGRESPEKITAYEDLL